MIRLQVDLRDLRHHFRGKRVILVWDGLPAHKSRIMKEYLGSQRDWLSEERLPGYAPDLNPVEMLWGNLQGQELAFLWRRRQLIAELAALALGKVCVSPLM